MGETKNKGIPSHRADPVAWGSGLLAALASCLVAPDVLGLLIHLPAQREHPSRQVHSDPANSSPQTKTEENKEVVVEWLPPLEEPRLNSRFVEANSEVPQNLPDKTENFSNRDQQASQPEAPVEDSEKPKVEGDEPNSQKIVEAGDPGVAAPAVPLIGPDSEIAKDFEQGTPVGKDDAGKPKESPAKLPEIEDKSGLAVQKVDALGEDEDPNAKRPLVLNATPAPPVAPTLLPSEPKEKQKPRPRLRLAPDLVRGPLMATETNAPRLGRVAIDCKLHAYGAYVQEMLQAIEDQWHDLGHGSRGFLNRNKLPPVVQLRFILDNNGRIHELKRLDRNGVGLGSEICRQAIESRAPYGKWTEEMIRDFGSEDVVTIRFHYK